MKKLIVLTLVFVLLSVTFVPAFAKGPSGKNLYALAGYIRAIDSEKHTITVEVLVGNRLATPFLNENVVIQIYLEKTGDYAVTRLLLSGGIPIDFDDLEVKDPVSSNGYLVDGIWHAVRVTQGALLTDYR
jgi:hypothetical protein